MHRTAVIEQKLFSCGIPINGLFKVISKNTMHYLTESHTIAREETRFSSSQKIVSMLTKVMKLY